MAKILSSVDLSVKLKIFLILHTAVHICWITSSYIRYIEIDNNNYNYWYSYIRKM